MQRVTVNIILIITLFVMLFCCSNREKFGSVDMGAISSQLFSNYGGEGSYEVGGPLYPSQYYSYGGYDPFMYYYPGEPMRKKFWTRDNI